MTAEVMKCIFERLISLTLRTLNELLIAYVFILDPLPFSGVISYSSFLHALWRRHPWHHTVKNRTSEEGGGRCVSVTCELIDFQWHPPIVPAGAVQSDLLSFVLRDQNPPFLPLPTTDMDLKGWMFGWTDRRTEIRKTPFHHAWH